jgi:hypothetical protein
MAFFFSLPFLAAVPRQAHEGMTFGLRLNAERTLEHRW